MERALDGVHEITGTGTLFPDEDGNPRLHMHVSGGRGESVTTGCARAGLVAWQILEVVMTEITGVTSVRKLDPAAGFAKLVP
jgi:predicted DNA-binding protein with PD1-like motif